jgi:hypothetical protein
MFPFGDILEDVGIMLAKNDGCRGGSAKQEGRERFCVRLDVVSSAHDKDR